MRKEEPTFQAKINSSGKRDKKRHWNDQPMKARLSEAKTVLLRTNTSKWQNSFVECHVYAQTQLLFIQQPNTTPRLTLRLMVSALAQS
jgi:hypothetical protein